MALLSEEWEEKQGSAGPKVQELTWRVSDACVTRNASTVSFIKTFDWSP